jgi:hypothetical protein
LLGNARPSLAVIAKLGGDCHRRRTTLPRSGVRRASVEISASVTKTVEGAGAIMKQEKLITKINAPFLQAIGLVPQAATDFAA